MNPCELCETLGGAVLWHTVGVIIDRLLAFVASTPDSLHRVLELGR